MSSLHRYGWIPILTLCAVLLSGCGGQEGTTPAANTGMANEPAANTMGNAPGMATEDTGEVREVEIAAEEMRYEPNEITVQPGQRLRVMLNNRGRGPHNIEFELPSGEVELEEDVPAGQTQTLEVQAPLEPGRYTFYCPVNNHREQGMTGTLIVAEDGAAGANAPAGTQ